MDDVVGDGEMHLMEDDAGCGELRLMEDDVGDGGDELDGVGWKSKSGSSRWRGDTLGSGNGVVRGKWIRNTKRIKKYTEEKSEELEDGEENSGSVVEPYKPKSAPSSLGRGWRVTHLEVEME